MGEEGAPAGGGTAGSTFRAVRAPELGEFLRSRRARVDPSAVGFPVDRRRTSGLRREELASLAGVTVSWLAKLEQGQAHAVSSEVLGSLGRALRLTEAERDHLFALAGFRTAEHDVDAIVTDALRALLDELEPSPAYLLDRCWNIIAWNQAEAALFPGLLTRRGEPNLLELVFMDDGLRHLMADHDEELVRLVSQFRLHRTDWPDDPHIEALVDRLRTSSPDFAALWEAKDVAPFVTTRRLFDHPTAGRLELDHHRLAVLDQPGLQLVVYTSALGTDGAHRLSSRSERPRN
jgi:transcriptional regulator with XRE-family HTH domain